MSISDSDAAFFSQAAAKPAEREESDTVYCPVFGDIVKVNFFGAAFCSCCGSTEHDSEA